MGGDGGDGEINGERSGEGQHEGGEERLTSPIFARLPSDSSRIASDSERLSCSRMGGGVGCGGGGAVNGVFYCRSQGGINSPLKGELPTWYTCVPATFLMSSRRCLQTTRGTEVMGLVGSQAEAKTWKAHGARPLPQTMHTLT